METLVSAKLYGPFQLNEASVLRLLKDNWVGVYILTDRLGKVRYVGRSDQCLKRRLQDHIGRHPLFHVSISGNAKSAYQDECRLYHHFVSSGIENDIHPAKPANSLCSCPLFGCYQ